ncbi:MAG: leucine efflux protein [marine bacterium B5-7]|nr:MAG: leucine efflux protein [marine bacterium B5-7]
MSFLDSLSFFLIMVSLAVVPSTSVALVVTRSATLGVVNGVAVATGIVLGDLVFIFLAILGLSIIAETMGFMFVLVKYIGAAYLFWTGYSLLTSQNNTSYIVDESKLSGNIKVSFLSGFFLTLGDVKAIFFYVSFFPAFIDLTTIEYIDLLIILFVTIATVGGVKVSYAIIAKKIVNMTQGLKLERGAKKIAGSFMIGAGSYLVVKA